MKQVRCSRGHFYDADKYDSCPHCANIHDSLTPPNVTMTKVPNDDGVTVTLHDEGKEQGNSVVSEVITPPQSVSPAWENKNVGDEPKTIGQFKKDGDPVVGWLVCTKGSHRGEDYRLRSGRNFIGRGADMDVCLKGETTVSRDKHAIVLYEPRQRIFLAQMGESRELVYLNGELLLSSAQMKAKDRLQIGDVEVMLIPCCDAEFDWSETDTKD